MPKRHSRDSTLSQSGQNLVRVVIASYFLAVALGLIPGTGALPLTEPFLAEPYADAASTGIVFASAYLVLIGVWLRLSALLLATVLFWSSYIENIGAGNVEGFWRDLALIGALILTYTQTLPRAANRRTAFRWSRRVRHVTPTRIVTPRRLVTSRSVPGLRLVASTENPVSGDNIFRDDPDLALAS